MADNFNLRSFLTENKLTKNAKLLNEVSLNGKPVNVGSVEIDGIDREDYPDFVDAYIVAAEYEDGTPLTDEELMQFQEENYDLVSQMIHDDQLYLEAKKEDAMEEASSEDMAYTEKVDEALTESKLTAKERRLVEMVQNALGIAPQAVAEEAPMADDEMVQENPLPKYNSIEELMKEIEHGTNEAAHKYKMDEMKRVYEALEAKVGALEEGEHAEHIDQKAVKQMRKDIAALRKAEEKLRKEFDKKFSGKEKKETPAKEKTTEALQEGFDLRKFLAENSLTTNSKMVNELSPELLNRAADKAKSQGRTLQANKFSNAALSQTYKAAAIEKSAKMEPMKPFEGKEVNLYYDIKTNQGIKSAVTVPHKISNIEIDTNGAMAVYVTQTSNNSIASQKAFFFIPEADHYRLSAQGFTHDNFLIRGLDQAGAQLLWKLAKAFKPDTQVTPNTLVDGAPTPLAGKAFQPTPAQ